MSAFRQYFSFFFLLAILAFFSTGSVRSQTLPAPSNVQVIDGAEPNPHPSPITVLWDSVPGAAGYTVYRSEVEVFTTADQIGYVEGVTSYTDSGPYLLGGEYFYWVSTHAGGADHSPPSQSVAATLLPRPSPPVNLVASTDEFERIILRWEVDGSPNPEEAQFDVYRSRSDDISTAEVVFSITLSKANLDSQLPAYVDQDVLGRKDYFYWVRNRVTTPIAGGLGPPSHLSTVATGSTGDFEVPTTAPGSVSATDGSDHLAVEITWESVPGARGYRVYRNAQPDFKTAIPIGVTNFQIKYQDIAAEGDTPYFYWVAATNGAGEGPVSLPDSGWRAIPTLPRPPAWLSASDGTYSSSVHLNFISPDQDITDFYRVYRSETDEFGDAVVIGTKEPSQPFRDNEVTPETIYYYWAAAVNESGEGLPSPSNSGYAAAPNPPQLPYYFSATDGTSTDYIKVIWGSSGLNRLFRSESSDFGTAELIVETTEREFFDRSAVQLTTYYYWLESVNYSGSSGLTAVETGFRSLARPEDPYATKNLYSDRIRLTWKSVPNAVAYRIFRNPTSDSSQRAEIASVLPPLTRYEDLAIEANVDYTYLIKAELPSGELSPFSIQERGYAAANVDPTFLEIPEVTDLVFDPIRDRLYVSTPAGVVESIDMATLRSRDFFHSDGTHYGIDLSDDLQWLAVATQYPFSEAEGHLHSIALGNWMPSTHSFSLKPTELGTYDVSPERGGRFQLSMLDSLITTPQRVFDPITGLASPLLDSLSRPVEIGGYDAFDRAPRNRTVLSWNDRTSEIRLRRLDDLVPTYLPKREAHKAAISPDGRFAALTYRHNSRYRISLYDQNGGFVGHKANFDSGVAFDGRRSLFYAVDTSTDSLRVFRTSDWDEILSLPIGRPVGLLGWMFGEGNVEIDPSGARAAIIVDDGIAFVPLDSVPNIPLPPDKISASDKYDSDGVLITWIQAEFADSYEVWRSPKSRPSDLTMVAGSVTDTVFLDTSAQSGTEYFYSLRSVGPAGESHLSIPDLGERGEGLSLRLTQSNLSVPFEGSATLAITVHNTTGTVSYAWFRGIPGDTSTPVGSDSDLLNLSNLTQNNEYWVRVSDDIGTVDSPAFTVAVLPPSVDLVEATKAWYEEFVRVSWTPLKEASYYQVYRASSPSFSQAKLVGSSGDSHFFDRVFPSTEEKYYFVAAVDRDDDTGPPSPVDLIRSVGGIASTPGSPGLIKINQPTQFRFTPDNSRLGIVSETGTIDFVDADDPFHIESWYHGRFLGGFDLATDGTRIVVADQTSNEQSEAEIHLFDTGAELWSNISIASAIPEATGTKSVIALEDSTLIVLPDSGSPEVPLLIVDPTVGSITVGPSVEPETLLAANQVRSKAVAVEKVGESFGRWRLYGVQSKNFGSPNNLDFLPLGAAVSPDGSQIAITGYRPDLGYIISVFHDDGTLDYEVPGSHFGAVFSPVQPELFVVDLNARNLRILDSATGTEILTVPLAESITPENGYEPAVEISSDGHRVAILTDGGIELLALPTTTPPIPEISSVSIENTDGIDIRWEMAATADTYDIWRGTSPDSGDAEKIFSGIQELQFLDIDVDPGKLYYYWVSATNIRGSTPLSTSAQGTSPIPVVAGLSASDDLLTDKVSVSWTALHPSLSYQVFRSESASFAEAILLGTSPNNSFLDFSSSPFRIYHYWVRGIQGITVGPEGSSDQGSRRISAPSELVASTDLSDRIVVSWQPMAGVSGYQLLRSSTPSTAQVQLIQSSLQTSFVDLSTELGTGYYYFVRAVLDGRLGEYSLAVEGRRPFVAPLELTATADRLDHVRLQWSPRDGAIRYQVLRSITALFSEAQVVGNPTATTWLDQSAEPGKEYHYWVRAVRAPNIPSTSGDPIQGIRFAGRGQELETPSDSDAEDLSDEVARPETSRLSLEGLVFASDEPESVLGSLRAQLFQSVVTVVLNFDGQTFRGRSSMDEDGSVEFTFTPTVDDDITLALQISASRDHTEALRLTGELNKNGSQTGEVFAISNQFHPRLNPAPFAGTYSLAIPHRASADPQSAPAGDGVAYGSISPNGRFLFRAILADTTRCVLRGLASDDGRLAFYQPLYRGPDRGHLAGVLRVRSIDNISDLDGRVHWRRPPGNSTPSIHEAGFDLALTTIGSKFNAPWRDQRVLSQFADSQSNGLWGFHGGNLTPIPSHRFVTWDARNRVTPVGLSPNERLFINVNRSTGLVSGRYLNTDAANKQTVPFVGIALQKQGLITGHFPGDNEVGYFTIEPAALPELTVRDFSGTEIVSGDSIDFGDTGVAGSTSERLLIIQNNGAGQLLIDEAPSLSNALTFHLVQARAGVLAPGESMAIRVGFRPSIEGNSTSTLVIPSNDAEVNPYRLTLTGVGVAGEASSSDPELPPAELSLPVLTGVSLDSVSPRQYDQENPPTGRYGGLIHPIGSAASIPIASGSATLSHHRPTGRGLLTVRIVMENSVGILRTFLEADGHADLDSARWTGPLSRNFAISDTFLGTKTDDEQIDMISISLERIGTGSPSATLQLFRQDFHPKNNPVPEEISGKFTVLLPLPDALGKGFPPGDGIATANIAPSGNIRMQIVLADGTPVTVAGGLDQTAGFSFYKGTNFDQVSGQFQIRPDAGQAPDFFTNTVSDLDGHLFWSKPASPRSRAYPAGFRLELPAVGSRFEYSRGAPLLAGLSEETEINANLLLDGARSPLTGEAETIASLPIQWLSTNRIHYQRTASEFLSLRVSPANGRVQGIYRHPVSGENLRLNGVVFQKQGVVGGHSLSADRTETGRIEITKIPAP